MYKLGIIGLSHDNGHPYSWSAIVNGYDQEKMANCPWPKIFKYLQANDPEARGIEEARVTHVWTQDREISEAVAGASLIENVVDEMTDLIGQVDGVILARDDGENHLKMAKPFIEADVPLFIDKPLTDNAADLAGFVKYYEAGKPIMSCSGVKYAQNLIALKSRLGRVLTANAVTPKAWSTYGIHLLEGVCAVMGLGIESVQNIGSDGEDIVHMRYSDGRHVVFQTFMDIKDGFDFSFYGDKGSAIINQFNWYENFKTSLLQFVEFLKTGKATIDWHDTLEMMKVVVGARISLAENNRIVHLSEIQV